ncbi:MAG: carboxymuconolactone decarboxylase family protein [Phycisphaerales bacterium]
MPRLNPIDRSAAPAPVAAQLDGIEKGLGGVPNIFLTMAQSPATLGAYLGLGQALGSSKLSAALREQIALTVAGINSCDYCASAHTLLGGKAGLAEDELARNLAGSSDDPATAAALAFAARIVEAKGFVTDDDLAAVRDAGYDDGQILDILTTVVTNVFTNWFNHIAQTEIDFPHVDAGEAALAH